MAMRISLEGKDITSAVAVSGAVIIDSAGGRLDSGEVSFSDRGSHRSQNIFP